MSERDHSTSSHSSDGPRGTGPDDVSAAPSLADTDESQEERGRIGYGPNERKSSWILGAILVLIVAGIGIYQAMGEDSDFKPSALEVQGPRIGQPAADFTLETFAGEPFTLSEHRGEVVVVNFWGSWCEPCRDEMPALQASWEEHQDDDVVFVGVGSKRDSEAAAVDFADEFGVTYPIGRDIEGGTVAAGQISKDYQITFYPSTFFIAPDGTISAIILQEIDEENLEYYIEQARDGSGDASASFTDPIPAHTRRD
jgi:peroxiredoxin